MVRQLQVPSDLQRQVVHVCLTGAMLAAAKYTNVLDAVGLDWMSRHWSAKFHAGDGNPDLSPPPMLGCSGAGRMPQTIIAGISIPCRWRLRR